MKWNSLREGGLRWSLGGLDPSLWLVMLPKCNMCNSFLYWYQVAWLLPQNNLCLQMAMGVYDLWLTVRKCKIHLAIGQFWERSMQGDHPK